MLDYGLVWLSAGIMLTVAGSYTVIGGLRDGDVHTIISILPLLFLMLMSIPRIKWYFAFFLLFPLLLPTMHFLKEYYSFHRMLPVILGPAYFILFYFLAVITKLQTRTAIS